MKTFNIYLISFIFIFSILFAQPREGRSYRGMERIENFKKVKMIETLNLDEETGIKLVSRYNKHRERIQEIEKERGLLLDKLETQIKANVTESEYQKTLNEITELEKKISESRKKYLDELKEIFTNKQISEYLVFERNFTKDLRNMAKDIQKERQRK